MTRMMLLCVTILLSVSALALGAKNAPPLIDANDRDAWAGDTRLSVPPLAKPPVCDGNIDAGEWAGATQVELATCSDSRNLYPRAATWYFGWDANALYLACRTTMMKEEKLKAETKAPAIELRADESVELWISPPESNQVYQVVISSTGLVFVQKRAGKDIDANVAFAPVAAAKAGEEFLDFEIKLPAKEFGLKQMKQGEAWRVLPVRAFRCGYALQAPLPCGLERDRSKDKGKDRDFADAARYPLLTLGGRNRPVVRLANPAAALYEGKAAVECVAVNGEAKPLKLKARLAIYQGTAKLFEQEREFDADANAAAAMKIDGSPESPIDSRESASYRYDYTLTAGREEILHTHFTYDPSENRPWLGDTIPKGSSAENEYVMVDPSKGPPPAEFEHRLQPYKDLPEGHKLRLTIRRAFEPSKQTTISAIQIITPLDANGAKDGEERFYNIYGYQLLRSVTYRQGVRHGPERLYASGQHPQTELPWDNGVVRGVKRSFHPDGRVMTEITYEDGRATGESKSYDPNGRVNRIASFKNGQRDGLMTEYYPAPPKRLVPYSKGLINGVVKEFYEGGKLKSETTYKNDVLHGVEKQYDESGKLSKTRYWLEGESVAEGEFNEKYKEPDARPDGKK